MMSMRQNYDGVSAYFNLPHLATHDAVGAPRLALQVAGEDVTGARAFHALPAFDNYLRRTYPVEIYNRGGGTLAWTAHASEPWVVLSKSAGKPPTKSASRWASTGRKPLGERGAGPDRLPRG